MSAGGFGLRGARRMAVGAAALVGVIMLSVIGGLAGGFPAAAGIGIPSAPTPGAGPGNTIPAAAGGANVVLAWAVGHVGRFTYNLGSPTDRGGSVADMQTREPTGSTCDCSMYARWAMAQAGLDVGLTTSTQWTANGQLPGSETPVETPELSRGVGSAAPPGGYQPADLIFFGHDDGPSGHVALWLGNGQIVQCSSSGGGSNIRALAGYVAPTGWVRWNALGQ